MRFIIYMFMFSGEFVTRAYDGESTLQFLHEECGWAQEFKSVEKIILYSTGANDSRIVMSEWTRIPGAPGASFQ